MILMEQGPDGLPDPSTEIRLPLHRGARFVLDTQRLWHVVCHTGTAPRYALITSFESGPALDGWIASQLPVALATPRSRHANSAPQVGDDRGVDLGVEAVLRVEADAVAQIAEALTQDTRDVVGRRDDRERVEHLVGDRVAPSPPTRRASTSC